MTHPPRERRTRVNFPPHTEHVGPPTDLAQRFLYGLILLVVLLGIFILLHGCTSQYRQAKLAAPPAPVRHDDGVLIAETPLRTHNQHGDYVRIYQYAKSQELVYYRLGRVVGSEWRQFKE